MVEIFIYITAQLHIRIKIIFLIFSQESTVKSNIWESGVLWGAFGRHWAADRVEAAG